MQDDPNDNLNKISEAAPIPKVLDYLARKGIAQVAVSYSGGNDDGHITEILVRYNDGAATHAALSSTEFMANFGEPLFEALCRPLDDKYYSWAGEFSAWGSLIWDAPSRKVFFDGKETEEIVINVDDIVYKEK